MGVGRHKGIRSTSPHRALAAAAAALAVFWKRCARPPPRVSQQTPCRTQAGFRNDVTPGSSRLGGAAKLCAIGAPIQIIYPHRDPRPAQASWVGCCSGLANRACRAHSRWRRPWRRAACTPWRRGIGHGPCPPGGKEPDVRGSRGVLRAQALREALPVTATCCRVARACPPTHIQNWISPTPGAAHLPQLTPPVGRHGTTSCPPAPATSLPAGPHGSGQWLRPPRQRAGRSRRSCSRPGHKVSDATSSYACKSGDNVGASRARSPSTCPSTCSHKAQVHQPSAARSSSTPPALSCM